MLAFNLLNSNKLLGNSKRITKGNLLAVSFVGAIYKYSFQTALTRPSNIASSILSVHLICVFLCPIGVAGVAGVADVAITLLWLIQEVGKDVGNVDYREGVGQGGGSIIILK